MDIDIDYEVNFGMKVFVDAFSADKTITYDGIMSFSGAIQSIANVVMVPLLCSLLVLTSW